VPRRSLTDKGFLAEQRRLRELGEKLKLPHDLRPLGMKVKLERKPKHPGGRPDKLTDKQIARGIAFLNRNRALLMEDAYRALRKLLRTDASDSTLWRHIWRERKR
jgi:hypothetical protein